jgi:hypothetical protein
VALDFIISVRINEVLIPGVVTTCAFGEVTVPWDGGTILDRDAVYRFL